MKYFNNPETGMVHAYDDDVPSSFVPRELVPMSDVQVTEYIEGQAISQASPEKIERDWRDRELASTIWLRDRHRDQSEIGTQSNLGTEQFHALLTYLQALRDWPQSDEFPDAGKRPVAPDFINESGDGQ
ncbi:phage tail assembly chaperone [Pseudomonas sp. MWU13-3659]|uniref:phage tail assembly chaperone n=1 Tax=Pseudomonas sp. MWU13-3659 TaxID=2986964 RepID=UPI0020752466|nr:phage tail assembly chaperone [Pseudomonas sp. MWU13-3659]